MLRTKEVQKVTAILDKIIEEYKKEKPKAKRDWRTYEQRLAKRIRTAISELEPLIDEAIASIKIVPKRRRGRKPELTLKQKTNLLLLKHLIGRSNREMSVMVAIFSALSGIDVSYKAVERLYSDEEVLMVLHNIHLLMLKRKGVKRANCSGDGTGYSLGVKEHYATVVRKRKGSAKKSGKRKRFVYSFKLIDLDTRMYVGYGTSFKSEDEAFQKAVEMAAGVGVASVRLDKYYSGQKRVELLGQKFGDVTVYLIPKKNATMRGPWEWKQMLKRLVNDPRGYLSEYFKRNQSESGFSEDKRRFGWKVAQKRKDRINTADFCTVVWHNLFWLG
jgi:transposase